MQLCDVWDLSLLSQGHQIDEEFKTTQPFFLCEWLLILLSSVSGLTLDDIPITAVKHWHMKNTKSTFDEIVLFKNRCYKTFKYLEHACWLIRWLTVIQWKVACVKINLVCCQIAKTHLWLSCEDGEQGGNEPAGITRVQWRHCVVIQIHWG